MVDRNKTLPFVRLTIRSTDDSQKVFHGYDDKGKNAWLGASFHANTLVGADQSTVDRLTSALSTPMVKNTFIQFGLFSHPHVEEILSRYQAKKWLAKGMTRELAMRQVDLYKSGTENALVNQSGVMMNKQDLIVTFKIPSSIDPDDREINEFKAMVGKFMEAISSSGIYLWQMDVTEYLQTMRMMHDVYGEPNNTFNEHVPLREQVFGPNEGTDYSDAKTINFNDGRYFGKALSVKFFPQSASLATMSRMTGDISGLSNQITDPYYLVMTMRYPDQVDAGDKVRRGSAMINHQAFGPMLRVAPILGYKKQGFDVLVDEIDGRGGMLCEMNLTLFLFSKDKNRVNKLAAGLSAYYSSLKFKMIEDARVLEPLWNELLPLNSSEEGIKNLFRFHTMGVAHAVQFLPVLGEWRGTKGGSMMFLTRHGQPATFDLFDTDGNNNGYICAESGAGKSFITQGIVRDYLAEGAKVWAIDAGRSYFKLNKMVGGEFIEFSPESDICLNPFTHVEDLDEEMDVLKATLAKMAAPEDGLSDHLLSILEQAIASVWQKYGSSATPAAVGEWLQEQAHSAEANRLATQLFPFTGGAYSRWFNGVNSLDFTKDFVVLELQDLKGRKALQQVILLQLMSRINHEIFLTRGRRKILIVDEAWELLDDPIMAKALVAIYRKARKHEGGVIVVTQSVADLAKSENSKAIIDNSTWSFILAQRPKSIDDAVNSGNFTIDPYGAYLMKTVHTVAGKYSEVMIRRSNVYGVYRNVVDDFTKVTFSTKGEEFEPIMNLIDQGVPAEEAVQQYMNSKEQSWQMAS